MKSFTCILACVTWSNFDALNIGWFGFMNLNVDSISYFAVIDGKLHFLSFTLKT